MGDGRQLNAMIRRLRWRCGALAGILERGAAQYRGGLTWKVTIARQGPPIHEVMRPAEPNVIAAGAELVRRLLALDVKLSVKRDPLAGPESLFIG